jgi:hypothetical protein
MQMEPGVLVKFTGPQNHPLPKRRDMFEDRTNRDNTGTGDSVPLCINASELVKQQRSHSVPEVWHL